MQSYKIGSQQAPLYYVLYTPMGQLLKLHIYIIGLHSFVCGFEVLQKWVVCPSKRPALVQ